MTAPLTQLEKFAKAQKEINELLATWRAGKATHESTLVMIDLIMREAK